MYAMKKLLPVNYPDVAWRIWADNAASHTPDIAALQENKTWLLFVCDDHQFGYKSHSWIEEYKEPFKVNDIEVSSVTAFTEHDYNFFYHCNTNTPVPLRDDGTPSFPAAKIKGELHLVRSEVFISLDKYRMNRLQFRRKRISVIVPYRWQPKKEWEVEDGSGPVPPALWGKKRLLSPELTHTVEAFMYVGKSSFWNKHIDGGYDCLQCPIFFPNIEKPWLPRYYEYTRLFEKAQRNNR